MQPELELGLPRVPIIAYMRHIYRKNGKWVMATRTNKKRP